MSARNLPAYSRHLKAALDVRGWTMDDLAAVVPSPYRLSKSTLDKIAQGKRPPNDYEYPLLANLLGVPEWFLRDGFRPRDSAADLVALLAAARQVAAALEAVADRLEAMEP